MGSREPRVCPCGLSDESGVPICSPATVTAGTVVTLTTYTLHTSVRNHRSHERCWSQTSTAWMQRWGLREIGWLSCTLDYDRRNGSRNLSKHERTLNSWCHVTNIRPQQQRSWSISAFSLTCPPSSVYVDFGYFFLSNKSKLSFPWISHMYHLREQPYLTHRFLQNIILLELSLPWSLTLCLPSLHVSCFWERWKQINDMQIIWIICILPHTYTLAPLF